MEPKLNTDTNYELRLRTYSRSLDRVMEKRLSSILKRHIEKNSTKR